MKVESTQLVAIIKSVTQLVRLKYRAEYRTKVTDLHIKQFEATEESLVDVLEPYFDSQISSIAGKLKSGSDAEAIVDAAFDQDKAFDDLIEIVVPILAASMEEAIIESLDLLSAGPEETRAVIIITKATTAREWLESQGITLPPGLSADLPEWMARAISSHLLKTFEENYWKQIAGKTREDVVRIVKKGLEEGRSITWIANNLADSFPELYSKNRALKIARTETGNALNGARRAAIDELAQEIEGIRPSWMSILAPTTRDTHAEMDGVVADADGLFNLSGYMVPHPAHHSLPPEERVNCLCTLLTDIV